MSEPKVTEPPPKRRLLRDLIVFQFKLIADGARDLFLSPLSFLAAVLDLISGKRGADSNFYSLLRAGKRTDEWIDLFGAAKRTDADTSETELDKALDRLEVEIAASYRDGKLNAAAKQTLLKAKGLLGAVKPPAAESAPSAEPAPPQDSDGKP